MAERKPGPVRPPVIDLEAREAPAVEPGAEGAAKRPPRVRATRRGAKAPRATAAGAAAAEAAAGGTPSPESEGQPPEAPGAMPPSPDAGVETGAPAPIEPLSAGPADDAAASTEPTAPTAESEPTAPMAESEPPAAADEAASPAASGPSEPEAPPAAQPQPEPLPPPPPRPPARLAMPWSAISVAALAGAVLGAALTYFAANWIALPTQAPPFEDPGPALAALSERAGALESRLSTIEAAGTRRQGEADALRDELAALGTALREEIAAVRDSIPEAQAPADFSAIDDQIQNLESRVTAIAAGASSDDAAALAESLGSIEQDLADLSTQLSDLASRVGTADEGLATLRAALDEMRTAVAAQNRTLAGAEVGPAVRLPLIVSSLESAFANGRPYDAELRSLTALLPDLHVPDAVAEKAADGLPRADAIGPRFEERLPAILAGRTAESTGDWTQDAIEWAKALLALRPAEEIEGSTPEAVVSRLEGAVERRDYSAAAAQLAQLPPAMRAASGEVGTDILALAEAEAFVTALRSEILAPAEPAN